MPRRTRHLMFVEMSLSGSGERCLEYCRERGYEATLLTRAPSDHAAVASEGTRVVECDTNDRLALVECVRAVDARHPVDGVTTTHDLYVPRAALAAEALGRPGLTVEAAERVRNKYRMRLALQAVLPHLNPPFRLVHTRTQARAAAAEWGFPLVAKPQDANDSWNVVKVGDHSELDAYLDAVDSWDFNPAGQKVSEGVLLEGYVDGPEHSVETVQHPGGEIELMAVAGKELAGDEGRHFAEVGVCLPLYGSQTERLFQEVSQALEALRVDCGAIHTECRIADDGVKILEVNPRLAGDMTGSHMIELALGASAVGQVVETALESGTPWSPTTERGAGKFAVCMPETGVFGGIENPDELLAQPGVEHVRLAATVGDVCHFPPRSNFDIVARVVTTATTADAALEAARRAARTARVRVSHAEKVRP